jgi:dTDP-4-amino-4,6-dideoxygalactose transaminase
MAMGIGEGDEVITMPNTFFATAEAIWIAGATAVFVDCDPKTKNIDPAAIEAAITPKTKAIMPVHLFGQMVDMPPLMALAAAKGIPVIEDACQSIGAADGRTRAGAVGLCGCFSFFPSKNLGGFGDGGLVTTSDAALAERLRLLRGHGAAEKYYHQLVGGNFRLDALQAVVLSVKLRHLPAWTEQRRRNADRYRTLFADAAARSGRVALGAPSAGPTQPGTIVLPVERPGAFHVYNQFVIRTGRRDAVKAHLTAREIGCEIYYPVPFHLQECFRALGHQPGDFAVSEAAAADSLALPIYAELTEDQQHAVVQAVVEAAGAPA